MVLSGFHCTFLVNRAVTPGWESFYARSLPLVRRQRTLSVIQIFACSSLTFAQALWASRAIVSEDPHVASHPFPGWCVPIVARRWRFQAVKHFFWLADVRMQVLRLHGGGGQKRQRGTSADTSERPASKKSTAKRDQPLAYVALVAPADAHLVRHALAVQRASHRPEASWRHGSRQVGTHARAHTHTHTHWKSEADPHQCEHPGRLE